MAGVPLKLMGTCDPRRQTAMGPIPVSGGKRSLHGAVTEYVFVFNSPNLVNKRELLSCTRSPC